MISQDHLRPRSAWRAAGLLLVTCLLAAATGPIASADITTEQATALGKAIEKSIAAGDGSVFNKTLDMPALCAEGIKGISAPAGFQNAFIKDLGDGGFGNAIAKQATEGASYRFLRVRGTPARPTLLFRLITAGGINYHELYLYNDAAQNIRINDIYIAVSGETFSQTLRKIYLPAAAHASKGKLARLLTADDDLVKNFDKISQMSQFTQEKKFKEALAIYDTLPASLKMEKTYMVQRVMNLMNSDDLKGYQEAIETYEKAFPGDPSVLIVSLDGYFLRKEYDKAIASIDALDKSVGGDPYLDAFRATAVSGKEDHKGARKLLLKVIAAEPTIAQPYYNLLELSLTDKDYKETARVLTLAAEKANVGFPSMQTDEVFAGFVKSPEGKAWLKTLKSSPETSDPKEQ